MDDERLAHLVQVLKQKQIWALNIGENFQITHYAWGLFLEELPLTAVSYLYVSEHHLKGTKLKVRPGKVYLEGSASVVLEVLPAAFHSLI